MCLLMHLVGFHYSLRSVYILSILLFLYSALRAHVRYKRLINTLYITLHTQYQEVGISVL